MSEHITVFDIERVRGDNYPIEFQLTDDADQPIDITGFTFAFTVDTQEEPPDELTQVFKLVGVITSTANGLFQFEPTDVQMDLTPGADYYWEVSQVDAATKKRTTGKGKLIIEQDKNKS